MDKRKIMKKRKEKVVLKGLVNELKQTFTVEYIYRRGKH